MAIGRGVFPALVFLSASTASVDTASADGAECDHSAVTAPPFGSTPCPGVRPGALLITGNANPIGSDRYCTLGFLFQSSRGDRYIATAAHCIPVPTNSETVWPRGEGAIARDIDGDRIGEFAYALHEVDASDPLAMPTADMALIRLGREVKASAKVCHFGGPTGLNADIVPVGNPVPLHHYGNTPFGGYFGEGPEATDRYVLPARTGVAPGMPDERRVLFNGYAMLGDSGGPVLTSDGRAVALFQGAGEFRRDGNVGWLNATRLKPQIMRAEKALRVRLRLLEAPFRAARVSRPTSSFRE